MNDWLRWLPFGSVPEIDAAAFKARLDQGEPLQLIDVRTPGEFARGHIQGAINVPISRLRLALPALALDTGRLVIAVCAKLHTTQGVA